MGTSFSADDEDLIICSIPSALLLPMGATVVQGNIANVEDCNTFAQLGPDQARWINHTEKARAQKADIDKIFINISGEERTYITTAYSPEYWDANAPSIDIDVVTPEECPEAYAAVKSILGIDRLAAARAAASPSLRDLQVKIVREEDETVKDQHEITTAAWHVLLAAGSIDWANGGKITGLREPTFRDAFTEVLDAKTTEKKAHLYGILFRSVIDPDNQEDPYDIAATLDPQTAFRKIYKVTHTFHKLLVQLKLTASLVDDDITAVGPELDVYHLLPQRKGSADIQKAIADEKLQQNEEIVGQGDKHVSKKKLIASKLGVLETLDDAVTLANNWNVVPLVAEKISEIPRAYQSIFYQVMQQFMAFPLRPEVQEWYEAFKSGMTGFVHWYARQIEIAFATFGKLLVTHSVVSKARAKDFASINAAVYEKVTKHFLEVERQVMSRVSTNAPFTDLSPTCPDHLNPIKIAEKKATEEAVARIQASMSPGGTRGTPRNRNANRSGGGGAGGGGAALGGGGAAVGGGGDVVNAPPAAPAPGAPSPSGPGDARVGRGRGNGGRGGGAGGRGNGGPGRGAASHVPYEDRARGLGSIYVDLARLSIQDALPATGLSRKYCADWITVGSCCTRPYGQCDGRHVNFDTIPVPADKAAIERHVVATDGLWFNKASVRTLQDAASKAKLGDASGPTGE